VALPLIINRQHRRKAQAQAQAQAQAKPKITGTSDYKFCK